MSPGTSATTYWFSPAPTPARPVAAVAVRARALAAAARPGHRPGVKGEQRGHARAPLEDDGPPPAAVAAVRATERPELLPVHRRAAVPAVACLQRDGDMVGELGHFSISSWWPRSPHATRADRPAVRPRRMPWLALRRNLLRRRLADHAHGPAGAHPAQRDHPADEREQGVVAAAADARAGVEVGAALAHDDLARVDLLTAEPLHAQPLRGGVTAVAAGRRALLVCHRQPFFRAAFRSAAIPVILTWV